MKIWKCDYDYRGGWGSFDEWHGICVADTKEEALEMSKDAAGELHSKNEDWEITEIDPTKKETYYVSSRTN